MGGSSVEPTFSALILSLAASAAIGIGLDPDPSTGKIEKNKDLARFNIDLLILLREKTKNNLDASEADLLSRLISDLQLKFIHA